MKRPFRLRRERSAEKSGGKALLKRIVQALLAVAGLSTFFLLVRDVDFTSLDVGGGSLALLALLVLALAAVNYMFDTLGWWLVCGRNRPSFLNLTLIRLRCEALTNLLPGGALIGEPMKIAYLVRDEAMTRAEAATSFLLSKFSLIVGQVASVVLGLAIAHRAINRTSEQAFGTADVATLALVIALGILTLVMVLVGAMIWFQPMVRWLAPSDREGKVHQIWNRVVEELHGIEALIAEQFRREGKALVLSVFCSFIAWSLNGVEVYLILRWFSVDIGFPQAYSIDAVSSVVRMVIFMLPIGIGGQDWAITGLMTAHGVADPVNTAARLVVLKRGREFFVIGLGLLLFLLSSRVGGSQDVAQAAESGTSADSLAAEQRGGGTPGRKQQRR